MAFQRVLRQYSNPYKDTVYITIRDLRTGGQQTIVSNRIHPFFVQRIGTDSNLHLAATISEGHVYRGQIKGGAWVDADHLKPGDRLLQSDAPAARFQHDAWSEVVSVTVVPEPLKAYNVTVETSETFYIRAGDAARAEDAVWVHNCPDWPSRPVRLANSNMGHATDRAVERAGYGDAVSARNAHQEFGGNIRLNGLPSRSSRDPDNSTRFIVPGFGNGGAVVYEIEDNGRFTFKTVLVWRGQAHATQIFL